VRQCEKPVEHPQLMHDFQGRGMQRVSAKVTQEIRVLFEYEHWDTGPGKQEPEHHPRRPPARDAAAHADRVRCHASCPHNGKPVIPFEQGTPVPFTISRFSGSSLSRMNT
jgi:hypothetical protein